MPNLHINQFTYLATLNGGTLEVIPMPPTAQQSVTFTTSTQSDPAPVRQFWQVVADADCFLEVGENPTATTGGTPLQAGQFFEFQISAGHRVAAVAK